MLELCQVYIVTIINDIQCISDRIDKIEAKIALDMSSVHPLQLEEDIIEELADRNRRSNNLIFYNLEESSAGSFEKNKKIDSILAIDILQCIVPDKVPISKVIRIGDRSQGRSRPLCVTLPSKEDAISILRKKNRYSRPVRIYPDQSPKQRQFFKVVKDRLTIKQLHDIGDTNKTIRYFNGVPKIVDTNQASRKAKN